MRDKHYYEELRNKYIKLGDLDGVAAMNEVLGKFKERQHTISEYLCQRKK